MEDLFKFKNDYGFYIIFYKINEIWIHILKTIKYTEKMIQL
jgi:hypothetical protein